MKKFFSLLIILANMFVSRSNNNVYDQYVNKSYIVMNALNNEVVEGKNINEIRSVASVSKIMSAIVAIENGDLNKEIIVTKEDIDTYGSSIYLKEGGKISLLNLLYGLLLRSGNDAAKVIARGVGGSEEIFVKMMNDKASEIGMKNSTFTNPSGLDIEETGNLSTSYDMALLMSYALNNEVFRKISSSKEYKSDHGYWANKNKLLRNYKYTIAGKTGFTYKAKRTLVTAAKKEESIFIVVTLDCGNDFNFHKFLYERNFNKYQSELILNKGSNYIDDYLINCQSNLYVTLERENIDEYSLIYEIDNKESKIYLLDDVNKKEIGVCKVSKLENNEEKSSFFEIIKKWLK